MGRYKEETVLVRMRRNIRKSVILKFKNYELRVKAQVVTTDNSHFESILPLIKIRFLKRYFIREEILFELKRIKGIRDADLLIEVFGVYGTENYIGEYKRYLGEMNFFMAGINQDDKATYTHKKSLAYFQQPEKSNFIPEGLPNHGDSIFT